MYTEREKGWEVLRINKGEDHRSSTVRTGCWVESGTAVYQEVRA